MEYLKLRQPEKERMLKALDVAVVYFGHDSNRLTKIEYAKEELKQDNPLSIVCDFISNLHLIKIAETGYNLNEEAYFIQNNCYPKSPGAINDR